MDQDIGRAIRLLKTTDLEGVSLQDLNDFLFRIVYKYQLKELSLDKVEEILRASRLRQEYLKTREKLDLTVGKIVAMTKSKVPGTIYFGSIKEITVKNKVIIMYLYYTSNDRTFGRSTNRCFTFVETKQFSEIRSATFEEKDILTKRFNLKIEDFA